jgi:hypothetical protein
MYTAFWLVPLKGNIRIEILREYLTSRLLVGQCYLDRKVAAFGISTVSTVYGWIKGGISKLLRVRFSYLIVLTRAK